MPHADFECQRCGTIEDLPVDCQRCPYCGKKRGFERLFNAVNVMSSHTRRVSKFLDKKLAPAYDLHSKKKDSAKAFEGASAEAMEKTIEKATPAQRERMATPMAGRVLPAGNVLGSMSAQARADVRECITPALLSRKVRPSYGG